MSLSSSIVLAIFIETLYEETAETLKYFDLKFKLSANSAINLALNTLLIYIILLLFLSEKQQIKKL